MKYTEQKIERLTRGLMTPEELREFGPDNVRAVLSEGRTQYAFLPDVMLAAEPDGEERRARYTMITQTALPPFDRVVLIDGIRLDEFKRRKSPFLFGHGDAPFPLGRMEDIESGESGRGKKKRKAMFGTANFLAAKHWEFARLAWEMVQDGILNGGSIGFDIDAEREPTKEEILEYGIQSQYATIATRIRLVEFSAVPLGRDPDAQVLGRVRNSYEERLSALCADGRCERADADEFLEMALGAVSGSTSYHLPPESGWGAGIFERNKNAQEGRAMCECGSATCNGCGGGDATQLQHNQSLMTVELVALREAVARLEGVMVAQRQGLERLRSRQFAFEAEYREALSQQVAPTYQPAASALGLSRAPQPQEVDVDSLPEDEQLEITAGALLAHLEAEDA